MRGMMAVLARQNVEYAQVLARSGVEPADLSGGTGKNRRITRISRGAAQSIAQDILTNPDRAKGLMRMLKSRMAPEDFKQAQKAVEDEVKAQNAPRSRQDMEYAQAVTMSGVNPGAAVRQQARPSNRHF